MCNFCDNYCFVKNNSKSEKNNKISNEHKVYVKMIDVVLDSKIKAPKLKVQYPMRKLKYCPSCGIRFGSKDFNSYYKEYVEKRKNKGGENNV